MLNYFYISFFLDICRKTCFLSLEINGRFFDDILIKVRNVLFFYFPHPLFLFVLLVVL